MCFFLKVIFTKFWGKIETCPRFVVAFVLLVSFFCLFSRIGSIILNLEHECNMAGALAVHASIRWFCFFIIFYTRYSLLKACFQCICWFGFLNLRFHFWIGCEFCCCFCLERWNLIGHLHPPRWEGTCPTCLSQCCFCFCFFFFSVLVCKLWVFSRFALISVVLFTCNCHRCDVFFTMFLLTSIGVCVCVL